MMIIVIWSRASHPRILLSTERTESRRDNHQIANLCNLRTSLIDCRYFRWPMNQDKNLTAAAAAFFIVAHSRYFGRFDL